MILGGCQLSTQKNSSHLVTVFHQMTCGLLFFGLRVYAKIKISHSVPDKL